MLDFDIIVVGLGHAGIEAALASARLGLKTAAFCLALDSIANLPCNPCIGGTAKGQIVSEIDALGGEMAKAADCCAIQYRTLGLGKGEAVRSLRTQIDRQAYSVHMKQVLEKTPNLFVIQDEVCELIVENGAVVSVKTQLAQYSAKAVVLTMGTYPNAKIHVGSHNRASAPDGIAPATYISKSLEENGIKLRRFKTGTPARVHRRSINFSKLEPQTGDAQITPFSFGNVKPPLASVNCFIAYTNDKVHQIIKGNIDKSAMYSGNISGVGPRYCPSIEDKIVRFADKERHQFFVEPCGLSTEEFYLQGLSTSLPLDVQQKFLREIVGLENVEIMRAAYAIEYDCCFPDDLLLTLEFRNIKNLFAAGQFLGTSGYEEAAGAGIVAGINAARSVLNLEPIILSRSSSYIGVLIDDIVTKGTNEPYRMMTARAEYRLLLRQDNAFERLAHIGREVGLLPEERYQEFLSHRASVDKEISRLKSTNIQPTVALNQILEKSQTSAIERSVKLSALLVRPQVSYDLIAEFDLNSPNIPASVRKKALTEIKYEGYIKVQTDSVARNESFENKPLPADLDYFEIQSLRLESREKLNKIKPLTFGQASRISGVSPADINSLLFYVKNIKNL